MTTARGRYAKGRQRREQILDTALEVFATGGFHASSTKEIARRVGVSEPTLFHYFGSKQALLVAVLQARDERSAAARAEPGTGPEALLETVRDNGSEPGLVRLYAVTSAEATDPGHAAHDWFARRYDRLRTALAAELEPGAGPGADPGAGAAPAGELTPDRVARLLLAAADGLQVQWLLDRPPGGDPAAPADPADPGGFDMAADLRALVAALVPPR
ncbi:TetR/AcrR family transcriptional regulator [Pseudonocardia alni]|uniref:TetR/AcrR family transcriptional regulator n=1 Tax=Pseudonocardia alni TaxID=33907 RepID=UPI00279B937D|nr:TetR/AcrR family transcriptional regulator [Pseudonocardia alni]